MHARGFRNAVLPAAAGTTHDHLLLGLHPEGGRIRLCLDRFLQSPEPLAQIVDIQQQQREDWWHLAKFQVSIRQRPLRHKKSPSKRKGFVIQLGWIKLELVEQI